MIEYLATCTNEGCPNNGVPSIVFSDNENPPSINCGPCGDIPITSIVLR